MPPEWDGAAGFSIWDETPGQTQDISLLTRNAPGYPKRTENGVQRERGIWATLF